MSKIDEIKEFIGYLKVIFAMTLATIIGLVGWFVQNFDKAEAVLIYSDIALILALLIALFIVHRKIVSYITQLRGL